MHLELRPDIEEVRSRWAAFWRGEARRPMVAAALPRADAPSRPRQYDMPHAADLHAFCRKILAWAEAHQWVGDLVPSYGISFAPDHLALMLGADMKYVSGTGWIEPFLTDYDMEIRFRPESKWWEQTVRCTRAAREVCDGKMLIGPSELQGGLDALSAVRGNRQLLLDLLDCPTDVKHALDQINVAVNEVRLAMGELYDIPTLGMVNRHGFYAAGFTDIPQCDFSAMIGPEMFREFGLPCLRSECEPLIGAEYHLDGPDAIRHLPAVCEVDKIRVIQWQPGAGEAQTTDWSDLYRRIDELGKGQIRFGGKGQMRRIARELRSRYVVFSSGDFSSADDAKRFLDELEEQ